MLFCCYVILYVKVYNKLNTSFKLASAFDLKTGFSRNFQTVCKLSRTLSEIELHGCVSYNHTDIFMIRILQLEYRIFPQRYFPTTFIDVTGYEDGCLLFRRDTHDGVFVPEICRRIQCRGGVIKDPVPICDRQKSNIEIASGSYYLASFVFPLVLYRGAYLGFLSFRI